MIIRMAGCRDCQQISSGDCGKHGPTFTVGSITFHPNPAVPVPTHLDSTGWPGRAAEHLWRQRAEKAEAELAQLRAALGSRGAHEESSFKIMTTVDIRCGQRRLMCSLPARDYPYVVRAIQDAVTLPINDLSDDVLAALRGVGTPLTTELHELYDALKPLLDNADGYDVSNVRAAFRQAERLPPRLLDAETRARLAWKELGRFLAVPLGTPQEKEL